MRAARVISTSALMIALGTAASAQTPVPPAYFSFGLYGGGSSLSDLQRHDLYRTGAGSAPTRTEQTVSAEPAGVVGAAATLWPARYWGMRASVAYGTTELALLHDRQASGVGPATGGAGLDIWLYDVSVVLRIPGEGGSAIVPYAILGAGGAQYRIVDEDGEDPPVRLFDGESTRTRLAGLAGAGVEVPLRRHGLSLTFELVDHFTRTPVESGQSGPPVDLRASAASAERSLGSDVTDQISVLNQIRFSAGFTYSLR